MFVIYIYFEITSFTMHVNLNINEEVKPIKKTFIDGSVV